MKIVWRPEVKKPGGEYWSKSGKEYVVLEVGAGDDGIHFRVEAEDGTPIVVQASEVKVTDGTIPPTWLCEHFSPNYLRLAPSAWLESEFWTRFEDDSRDAIIAYRIERDKIIAASDGAIESRVCECPGCGSGTHADRHGPCNSQHADEPHLWERVWPSHGRELNVCPACFKARVSWK